MLKMKEGKKFDLPLIKRHVENLKKLDAEGKLVLCGPFKDFAGGMLIVKAASPEEARAIAESDPFVGEGFESYELREWELASKENNYLL
ncbi:MAG: hypothetical protein COT17_08110 [Elusimicrobia bacterium CG08_land_8_20_14_0_20_51_18]|nr:MAG: hypothetical protein COT17_08110 [Elusimicrobia bacterium CG08_land_8_20_14_0_20_51_18]